MHVTATSCYVRVRSEAPLPGYGETPNYLLQLLGYGMRNDNRMGKKLCGNLETRGMEERDRGTQEQGSGYWYNVKMREERRGKRQDDITDT
jgi:hypothetical protein